MNSEKERIGRMFGEFVKERRLSQGISLRQFSRLVGFDPGNWSKVERGLLNPPRREETLKRIAKVLRIKTTSDDWREMKDKAHIDAGRIPRDVLSDAKLVRSLPLLFRTFRNTKPTPGELDQLIQMIQKRA
jgi:transcriptional regulator with XRE-family HTH domain